MAAIFKYTTLINNLFVNIKISRTWISCLKAKSSNFSFFIFNFTFIGFVLTRQLLILKFGAPCAVRKAEPFNWILEFDASISAVISLFKSPYTSLRFTLKKIIN